MVSSIGPSGGEDRPAAGGYGLRLVLSWLWVGIPLAWGVSQTILQSLALFR